MAIHCESVSEQDSPYATIASSGLPRLSLRSFLAMTKIVLEPNCTPPFLSDLVIARDESPWRSTVGREAKRQTRSRPSRHDGLPRRPFCPPRNDKHNAPWHILSSRGRSPWRSTVRREAKRIVGTRSFKSLE